MKESVSPRRMSKRVVESVAMLFILVLIVIAYAATSVTAFADSTPPLPV